MNIHHQTENIDGPFAEEHAIDKLHSLLRARKIPLKEISKGIHLYSYRQSKTGIQGMAKPCYRCIPNIIKF